MTAIAARMSDYRLQYLDRTRKFIRADHVDAESDQEAIEQVRQWPLVGRSELWKDTELVAKFPRRSQKRAPTHAQQG